MPEAVDQTYFIQSTRMRKRLQSTEDPMEFDLTSIPADEPQEGDEIVKNQARFEEVLAIHGLVKLDFQRKAANVVWNFLSMDRAAPRLPLKERLRRWDAPPRP